jgi:hypothetical protein
LSENSGTKFSFLHASDLHIASSPDRIGLPDLYSYLRNEGFGEISARRRNGAWISSHDDSLLEGLARLAYQRRGTLDGIVLSGDLATTGSSEDLAAAHAFVFSPAHYNWLDAEMAPTLQGAGVPVFLIPGNHDRAIGRLFLPGGREFDSRFGRAWSSGQGAQPLGRIEKQGIGLLLVGADFSLRRLLDSEALRLGWCGQGRAYRDIVKSLKRISMEHRRDCENRNVIPEVVWVLHYPPEHPTETRSLKLAESNFLVDSALHCGVQTILSGHTHQAVQYDLRGGRSRVFCAGTASQYDPFEENWVHIVTISQDAVGRRTQVTEDFRWDDLSQEWLPATTS